MKNDLYPELPDNAKEQTNKLIDKFKDNLKKITEEIIGDFYCDVTPHIESDHWANYQQSIINGLRDYPNYYGKEHNFKTIRELIFKEHREEIIKDINKDLLDEIESLKKQIEYLIDMSEK